MTVTSELHKLFFLLKIMEAVFWEITRPNTAHRASGDGETSRVCGLKPQVVVDAVSVTQGISHVAWLYRMILHDARVFRNILSLSNDNSRGKIYEIRAEAGADFCRPSRLGRPLDGGGWQQHRKKIPVNVRRVLEADTLEFYMSSKTRPSSVAEEKIVFYQGPLGPVGAGGNISLYC